MLNFFRRKFKGFFFLFRLHIIFGWCSGILIFLGNLIRLSSFISKQKSIGMNDFYSYRMNYKKREKLFDFIVQKEKLDQAIDYIELGVADGGSFFWWAKRNADANSRFYGFDTFEGLPEDWGSFKKGDMTRSMPSTEDSRCKFYKGLFQETLPGFVKSYNANKRIVLHCDADLFSSTLFGLTTLAPLLKKGDIIMFDEFNVPMHEFYAWDIFCKSYYIKYEVLAGVNNFYQTAFKIL